MKRAGILALILGAVICLPGCGFSEGAGATVTVVRETPTPTPTPTPEATPTPEPTPVPEYPTEQTASGVVVTKIPGTYTTSTDVNLRADASADAALVTGVTAGTQLTGTGVCDNGWIQVEYNGQVVYGSGDYLLPAAPAEAAPADQAAAEAPAAEAAPAA
ncbi:MAG: SH3 domain-containing protein [Blautia sp.]|nr:SH3 domain-containing protein [Blautia sp.]